MKPFSKSAGRTDMRLAAVILVLAALIVGIFVVMNRNAPVDNGRAPVASAPTVPIEGTSSGHQRPAPPATPALEGAEPDGSDVARGASSNEEESGEFGYWTGRVSDAATGKPIVGASVSVVRIAMNLHDYLSDQPHRSVQTDNEGRYRIAALDVRTSFANEMRLKVEADGYETKVAKRHNRLAKLEVDFALRPGTTIVGRVEDEAGAGLPNVALVGIRADVTNAMHSTDRNGIMHLPSALSGNDGLFVLKGVLAETPYRILASSREHGTTVSEEVLAGRGDVVIVMPRGSATLAVKVTEADGRPAPGVVVAVNDEILNVDSSREDWDMYKRVRVESTGADGIANFLGLHPGDYELNATDENPATRHQHRSLAESFSLADEERKELHLKFEAPRAFLGRAVDADSKQPIAGIRFSTAPYIESDADNWQARTRPFHAVNREEAVSAGDGTFRLEIRSNRGAGAASVYFEPPAGFHHISVAGQHTIIGGAYLESVGDGIAPVEIAFRRAGSLKGIVLKSDESTPVPGVAVSASVQGHGVPVESVVTDEAGRFTLIAAKGANLAITVTDDFGVGSAEALVEEGAEDVVIVLQEWGSVSGHVYADGKGIRSVQVNLWPAREESMGDDFLMSEQYMKYGDIGTKQVVSDEEGYFYLERIPAGVYTLGIDASSDMDFPYAIPEPRTVEVMSGQDLRKEDIHLEEGGIFSGLIVNEHDEPLSSVRVHAGMVKQGRSYEKMTGPEGVFSIVGVSGKDEEIHLSLHHKDYMQTGPNSFNPADSPVRIVLQKNPAVLVRVLNRGVSVPNFSYRVLFSEGEGRYHEGVLPRGEHQSAEGELELALTRTSELRIEVAELDEAGIPTGIRGGADFTPEAGKRLEVIVSVSGGTTVPGRVVLHPDNTPVAGAEVRITSTTSGRSASSVRNGAFEISPVTTDAGGHFILKGVPFGRHTVEAEKEGMVPSEPAMVSLEAGVAPEPIEIILSHGGVIFGKVIDPQGKPVDGAIIHHTDHALAARTNEWQPKTVTADAEGRYRIEGAGTGTHYLFYTTPSGRPIHRNTELAVGEEKEINFDLSDQVALSGRIMADGKPSFVFQLELKSADGTAQEVMMIPEGYWCLLAPGEYTASVRRNGRQGIIPLGTITIEPEPVEQTHDFTVDLVAGDVVVVFPRDEDFINGVVAIAPPGSDFKDNYTEVHITKPNHRFRDLMPGEYIATYTSQDKQWRGDSEPVMLAKDSENIIVIDARKIARDVRIGEWADNQLTEEFQTLTFDITPHVRSAGNFTFLVEYGGGSHAVVTDSVAVYENGNQIGIDAHRSWSGVNTWANTYSIRLAEHRTGSSYSAHIRIRSDGGTNSMGTVWMKVE